MSLKAEPHLWPHVNVTSTNILQVSLGIVAKVIGSGNPQTTLPACQLVLVDEACNLAALANPFKQTMTSQILRGIEDSQRY